MNHGGRFCGPWHNIFVVLHPIINTFCADVACACDNTQRTEPARLGVPGGDQGVSHH